MLKENQNKRQQKQVYIPAEVGEMIKVYREEHHVFSDNQAIINLIIEGYKVTCQK